MTKSGTDNVLYYGDNLEVLRKYIKDETVDLCYIDPPFNSKRNYNQIYNNIGSEDRAQAQAFVDTWTWDDHAISGLAEILSNEEGKFQPQTVELIKGFHSVLGNGSLLAYLVSMTLRITELYLVLKKSGSLYLHCDPTASHYLKIILDGIFCSRGGDFRNEIIWRYKSGGRSDNFYPQKHDVIFWYSKSAQWKFNGTQIGVARNVCQECHTELAKRNNLKKGIDSDGRIFRSIKSAGKTYTYYDNDPTIPDDVWLGISHLQQKDPERLGYPTQKPEALLERIIKGSTNEDDTVLDAYCGCGTTVAVAQRLKRKWIGIDITYQSISLVLKRLEDSAGKVAWPEVEKTITLNGIPQDMTSAEALAHKKDDRVRKEFEKWAVLTYTNNRGIINDKKGADAGIDGTVYFMTTGTDNAKMVLQVKSGGVGRGDIAKLRGDMDREGAVMATFITLEDPTAPMITEAKGTGRYHHAVMGIDYDKIQIVTIKDIVEQGKRIALPMSQEVVKAAPVAEEEIDAPGLPGLAPPPLSKGKKKGKG